MKKPPARAGGHGSGRRPSEDALTILERDHRHVAALFDAFMATGDRAVQHRRELVDEISEHLAVHAGIEETVLYPAARAALEADGKVVEALEEHHVVKSILAELSRTSVEDERYRAKVSVLAENVRHHVREEEDELFPQLRRLLSADQLGQLGDLLKEARLIAPRMAHPHAPDEPPGNLVATALTLPLDLAGKAVRRVVRRIAG